MQWTGAGCDINGGTCCKEKEICIANLNCSIGAGVRGPEESHLPIKSFVVANREDQYK